MSTHKHPCIRDCRTIWNTLPGGFKQCLNDGDFTIVEVNRYFLEMFGFSRQELASQFGNRFLEMIHPDDREGVLAGASALQQEGDEFRKDYRVLCRDGNYIWVVESAYLIQAEDGNMHLLCVFLEAQESREAQEELRLSLERIQIIMNQAADIIFEWNVANDTVVFSPNWEKKFGYTPHYDGRNQLPGSFHHVHPDDFHILTEFMEQLEQNKYHLESEMRIQNASGQYIWCQVCIAGQYDNDGNPLRAVGIISDIDKKKRLFDDMRRRAERDALTGLYNRAEIQRQVKAHLDSHPEELCALFMIDTDNFKQVNDVQGHLFGDAVLSELAASMKRLTRQSDLVGRIGGDEFTIFLKDISCREVAEEKAALLVDAFQHLFEGDKRVTSISCSIGVALYPEHGNDFETLYYSADQALYRAKDQGKGRYVVFEGQTERDKNFTERSALRTAIDSDQRTSGLPGDLTNYVFQILYNTADLDHAIQVILEIVGKRFDVSRAYIFENSEDGKYCDNTYEWCNVGIEPQKEHLQHFPYEEVDGYAELFKDNSIFYCRDIYTQPPEQIALFERQGIRSTLQCSIREEGVFRGFVGFDECTGLRMWTKEEIGMLSLISQLLTTFLQKKRAADKDRRLTIQLNTILDAQDSYIYAIDKETYELLYLNRKTRELDPSVRTGTPCHLAFFNRNEPCKHCPLAGDREIYNPKYGVWTNTQITTIQWGDQDAYLLSCQDITRLKEM